MGIVLGLTFLVIINTLVLRSFDQIENNLGQKNLDRMIQLNTQTLQSIDTKVVDWAWWDDTYNYILSPNPEYVTSNLTAVGLSGLKVDSMLFFDADKKFVNSVTLSSDEQSIIETPVNILSVFTPSSPQFVIGGDDDKQIGLFQHKGETYSYVVRPVLTSEKLGPRAGYIVFVQDYALQLSQIKDALQLPVALERNVISKTNQTTWLDSSSKESIYGNMKVVDFADRSLGTLQFKMPRDVSTPGRYVLYQLLAISLVIILLIMFVMYKLVRIIVIDRILLIRKEVTEVKTGGNKGDTITELPGNDELSELSKDLNEMLFRLQSTMELAKVGSTNVRSYIDVIGLIIVVIDKSQKIVLINKKASEVLGVSQDRAVGMNWFDHFIDEQDRPQTKRAFTSIMKGEVKSVDNHSNWIVTKGGKRYISWSNTVMLDDKGRVLASLSAGEDITEKAKQDDMQRMHQEELEKINALMVDRELKMIELKNKLSKSKQ